MSFWMIAFALLFGAWQVHEGIQTTVPDNCYTAALEAFCTTSVNVPGSCEPTNVTKGIIAFHERFELWTYDCAIIRGEEPGWTYSYSGVSPLWIKSGEANHA